MRGAGHKLDRRQVQADGKYFPLSQPKLIPAETQQVFRQGVGGHADTETQLGRLSDTLCLALMPDDTDNDNSLINAEMPVRVGLQVFILQFCMPISHVLFVEKLLLPQGGVACVAAAANAHQFGQLNGTCNLFKTIICALTHRSKQRQPRSDMPHNQFERINFRMQLKPPQPPKPPPPPPKRPLEPQQM